MAPRSDVLSVRREGVWIDTDVLQMAASRPLNSDSREFLNSGLLLEGITIREPQFEDWLDAERSSFHSKLSRVLEQSAEHLIAKQDFLLAAEYAEKLIGLDNFSESAHRLMLRCLQGQGEVAAALRHFDQMKDLFRKELKIVPGEQTTELVQSIRSSLSKRARSEDSNAIAAADMLLDGDDAAPADIARHGRSELKTVAALAAVIQINNSGDDFSAQVAGIRRIRDRIAEITSAHGGALISNTGTAFQAVFGVPVAHSKDVERCLICAKKILEEIASDGTAPTASVKLAAVAGRVLSEPAIAGENLSLLGDPVQRAQELLSKVEPNSVRVDDNIRNAVTHLFRFEATMDGSVRLVTNLHQAKDMEHTGFVGRDAEFARIVESMREVTENRQGEVVLLRGEAGIGKTRLTEEIASHAVAMGIRVEYCRVLDFGEGRAEGAVACLATSLSAERTIEFNKTERSILSEMTGEVLSTENQALVAELDSSTIRAERSRVLCMLLEAAVAKSPIAIIVDDIHWAEQETLDLLADLAASTSDIPVTMVFTTRPGGDPVDSRWRARCGGLRISTIDVPPLRKQAATALAASVRDLPAELIEDCVDRAEGNPLFIEQLVRNADRIKATHLPLSVQSVVQEQLDSLPPQTRETIQAASIFGQIFNYDALASVCGESCASEDALCATNLVIRRGSVMNFVHALVRDGAYESITLDDRHRLHCAAANWFKEIDPRLWARHLDAGASPDAGKASYEAASLERQTGRLDSALALAKRAGELSTSVGERHRATLLLAEILRDLEQFEASIAELDGIETAETETSRAAKFGMAESFFRLDSHDRAWNLLSQISRAGTATPDKAWSASVACLQAGIEFARGNSASCVKYASIAHQLAFESGDARIQARALSTMADAEQGSGLFHSAERSFVECVSICRGIGSSRYAVNNEKMIGDLRFYDADFPSARDILSRVLLEAQSLGNSRAQMNAEHMLSYIDCMEGDFGAALERTERALRIIESSSARRFIMNNGCFAAMSLGGLGRHEEALERLQRSESTARSLNVIWVLPWVLAERAKFEAKDNKKREALDAADRLVAAGRVTYPFDYYRAAIDAALVLHDWSRAIAYADRLDTFFEREPVGLQVFVSARARAISAAFQGNGSATELSDLISKAQKIGYSTALEMLDFALASC